LALEKGFKIYNHECYRCFLQKVMNQDLLAHTFDRLRRIRNNANYYAKQYNVVETKIFLGDCESFTNFLIK
jgi:hypothetical protein